MKNNIFLETALETALEAAQIAGKVLLSYWGKISSCESKSHAGDLVTNADREAEIAIKSYLLEKFPSHSFLGEEGGAQGNNESFTWIVDPLDGTTNYTHQYPMVSVSIGLVNKKGPLVGVVFNPIMQECFWASIGNGAYLNGKPIHVSKVSRLEESLLATGFAYDRTQTPDNNYKEFCHMTSLSQGVRRGGSAALDLSYVAAGRLDGFWERGLKPWDMAAGWMLVLEAGGRVSGYDGGEFDISTGRILATNGLVYERMIDELKM